MGVSSAFLEKTGTLASVGPLRDCGLGSQSPSVRELIFFLAILGWAAAGVVLPLLFRLRRRDDPRRGQ